MAGLSHETTIRVYGSDMTDDGWAVGGSGAAYCDDGTWTKTETPTGQNLKAVVRGDIEIAVGAGGTIIER